MKTRNTILLAALMASAVTGFAYAQQPAGPLPVAGAGRQLYKTVEVNADRSVTLKIGAPGASAVQASIGGKDYPMSKDADGVWTATSAPLEPQVYNFSFKLAGATVNADEIEVPGSTPQVWEHQKVPHGTVTLVTYDSKIQNRKRPMRIYLPPQYYSEPTRKFPVMYLFNGNTESLWTQEGRANVVLDNLIAQGKAVPMIVVMPNNTIRDDLASSAETVSVLEKEIPGEIMPIVEKNYRALTARKDRAIAGLSFGGGTAFGVGMRNMGLFDYIGEFGTGTFGGLANPTTGYVSYMVPYDAEKIAPDIYKNLASPATRPKLFYMSVGATDPRRFYQEKALEDFRQHGIQPVFTTFPGGHEVRYFRAAMGDFATRIFK